VHINRKRQSDSQTALDAQSSAQEARPTRRAFNTYSLQRIALTCLGVLGTGGLLVLAGCPANLENPERFDVPGLDSGTPGAGGGSAGGASTIVPAPACATDVFKASCIMCHVPGNALEAGLDLTGADVANRLVNVNAGHALATAAMCSPSKLIDPVTPANSWLLAKINGTQGMCGAQMPFALPPLAADKIACLTAFAMSEASGGAAPPTGGAGAAATATGGSGGM
jgi:hypothetical protein